MKTNKRSFQTILHRKVSLLFLLLKSLPNKGIKVIMHFPFTTPSMMTTLWFPLKSTLEMQLKMIRKTLTKKDKEKSLRKRMKITKAGPHLCKKVRRSLITHAKSTSQLLISADSASMMETIHQCLH
jgi:hypothetical protein